MDPEDDSEYVITIDYEGFITRLDLDEILSSIDQIIEAELFDGRGTEAGIRLRRYPSLLRHWAKTLASIDENIETELREYLDPEGWYPRRGYPSLLRFWAGTLASIDDTIQTAVRDYFDYDARFPRRRYAPVLQYFGAARPELTYLGIKSVGPGSFTLSVFAGGVVLAYVGQRFKKGLDTSLLAEELERSGHITGDLFGSVLAKVNNWAEHYVPRQKQLGGKVTQIVAQRKRRKQDSSNVEP